MPWTEYMLPFLSLRWVKTAKFVRKVKIFLENSTNKCFETLEIFRLALFVYFFWYALKIHQFYFAIKSYSYIWRYQISMRNLHIEKKRISFQELLHHFVEIFCIFPKIIDLALKCFGKKLQNCIIVRWRVQIFVYYSRVLF